MLNQTYICPEELMLIWRI